MKIVIASDSFKGNLSSLEVAAQIEKGIHKILPNANCIKIPMADGGEGTVQALVQATDGKFFRKKVTAPDKSQVIARYGILGDGCTAVIEMAEASGLHLISSSNRQPLNATSYGTGELIADAMKRGVESIIIGLGGSATIDGGIGMAQALGIQFLDKNGVVIKEKISGGLLKPSSLLMSANRTL